MVQRPLRPFTVSAEMPVVIVCSPTLAFPRGRTIFMTNDKAGDLKSKYESNSAWADRPACLIIVGLAVEIAAVFILKKPWLEGGLTMAASVLIVLGVWGELLFSHRAKEAGDGIVAEANARAAEANQRAAEAQLLLVEFRKPRRAFSMVMSSRYRPILSSLNEGQAIEYEEVSNKGKTSAENLRMQR
jgi:hypothetical protein